MDIERRSKLEALIVPQHEYHVNVSPRLGTVLYLR